ncbi:MAG TPA: PIN domain-containing protein [Fimbriimonadaceae bacterium]
MSKAILDTDILSEIFRGKNKNVMRNAAAYVETHSRLTFTSITLYEIITGLEQNQANSKLAQTHLLLLENEEIVPTSEDYFLAGRILGSLRRTGKEVGYSDPLIAACAIHRNLQLITGNQKHFRLIEAVGFPILLGNWRSD